MVWVTRLMILVLTIVAAKCQSGNADRNQVDHRGFPFNFMNNPYFPLSGLGFYDPTTAFKNKDHLNDSSKVFKNNFQSNEGERLKDEEIALPLHTHHIHPTTESLDSITPISQANDVNINQEEIDKIFKKRTTKCITNCIKDETSSYTEKEPTKNDKLVAANPLNIPTRSRFSETNKKVLKKSEKHDETDIESAIVFRDDEYDPDTKKSAESEIRNDSRFAEALTRLDKPADDKNMTNYTNTELSKNSDYFLIPATMPISQISTNKFSDPVNVPSQTPATSTTNYMIQGNVNPIQYATVSQNQGQGTYVPINNVPIPTNNVQVSPNTFTLLNVPNSFVQGNIPNQQNIVYYLLNPGNIMNNGFQLMAVPNTVVGTNNQQLTFSNQGQIQPNNIAYANQNTLLTNTATGNTQPNLITFSNQQNYVPLINQQNLPTFMNQANNLVAYSNQPSLVVFTNTPNTLANQGIVNQPIQDQARNFVITSNQPNIQADNMAIVTNQPGNIPASNLAIAANTPNTQVSNMIIATNQPNNIQADNLVANTQSSNLVIAPNNIQANNLVANTQSSNLVIATNQPNNIQANNLVANTQSSNLVIATNQPNNIQANNLVANTQSSNLVIATNQPNNIQANNLVANTQSSNLVIATNQPNNIQTNNLVANTQSSNLVIASNQPNNIQTNLVPNNIGQLNNLATVSSQPNSLDTMSNEPIKINLSSNSATGSQSSLVVFNNGGFITSAQNNGGDATEGPLTYLLVNTKDEVQGDSDISDSDKEEE